MVCSSVSDYPRWSQLYFDFHLLFVIYRRHLPVRIHLGLFCLSLIFIRMFAASALAANTIFRSAVGAAFRKSSSPVSLTAIHTYESPILALFTSQMFEAMTIQGACSLIGGVGILLMPIPFVFYKYGAKIREKSTFAPCFASHLSLSL